VQRRTKKERKKPEPDGLNGIGKERPKGGKGLPKSRGNQAKADEVEGGRPFCRYSGSSTEQTS